MQQIMQGKIAAASTQDSPSLSLKEAHQLFWHHNENWMQEIAKALGIVLTQGPMEVCETCSIVKAKQKNT